MSKKFYALILIETESKLVTFAQCRAESYKELQVKIDEELEYYNKFYENDYRILEIKVTEVREKYLNDRISFMYKELVSYERYSRHILRKYKSLLEQGLIATVELFNQELLFSKQKEELRSYIVTAIRRAQYYNVTIDCKEALEMYEDMKFLESIQ